MIRIECGSSFSIVSCGHHDQIDFRVTDVNFLAKNSTAWYNPEFDTCESKKRLQIQ